MEHLPRLGDYLLRWIFSFVDFYILSGAIALVVIAMGGKGQRIGDIVAGTSVVKLIEQHEISRKEVFVPVRGRNACSHIYTSNSTN